MNGYLAFLRKDLVEITRTWRIWVVGLLFLGLGVLDPVLARYSKQIIGSALGSELGQLQLPDPVWADAWAQWAKDLTQTLVIMVCVLAAGSVAGETSSGTAVMPLSKPVSRTGFVLAKFTSTMVLTLGALVLGTVVACLVTGIVFDGAQYAPVWRAAASWAVLAGLVTAWTLVASVRLNGTIAAFGAGFGCYLLISIAAIWPAARRLSPAGLASVVGQFASNTNPSWQWPVVTGVLAMIVLVWLACILFGRREL